MWGWSALSIAALGAAFAVGSFVRSPWETAVENSEARPTVSVPVEHRDFAPEDVSIDGVVSLGAAISVEPTVTGGSQRPVVTRVHRAPGELLLPGQALVDVSGRPVIALDLRFPLYRDLHPGDTGADVEAVQQSLKSLGLYPGAVDGDFGAGTSAALSRMYVLAGVETPPTDPALREAAEAAQLALDEGSRQSLRTGPSSPQGDVAAEPSGAEVTADTPDLTKLRGLRDEASTAAGAWLPWAEIVDVPASGAQVVSIQPEGTVLPDETPVAATLRAGAPVVAARATVPEIATLALGAPVTLTSATDNAVTGTGVVLSVSDFQQADPAVENSVPGYDVVVAVDTAAHSTFADADRVLVRSATAGQTVSGLAVPLIALHEDSTGTYVLVVVEDSAVEAGASPQSSRVDVVTGIQQDGYILVETDDLAESRRVLVTGQS